MSQTELIKSVSIENLLSQRDAIQERFSRILALLTEAKQIAEAAHLVVPGFFVSGSGHWSAFNETELEHLQKKIDASAWQYLMNESGNMAFMDAKAREEWTDKIRKYDVPPLTYDNIKATFCDLHAGRQEMFNRGVLNIFKGLSWDYKTNSPWKFGKRLIVRYISGWNGNADKVDDLMRAFCVLDGKPEPEYRNSVSEEMRALRYKTLQGIITTPYFTLRTHKCGTGHIAFTRPDLVEKLNFILAIYFPFSIPDARTPKERKGK